MLVTTLSAPLDITPPTVPTNLQSSGLSPTGVTISWTPSTDNVGVAGYDIFRNGQQIATTAALAFSDTNLTSSSAYTYTVAAFDAAGNVSAMAAPAVTVTTLSATNTSAYPLKVSSNGRYLVDQNNAPLLIVGDSPQALIGDLSMADAQAYLADRQAHGFNSVWINLLCNWYTACNSDGTTFDGIAPFTTPGDLSTPNEAYFERADAMINLAAQYGLTVFLDPIETGGWLSILNSNGVTKDFNYGVYLANRYKNFPNIVWQNGNDFQTWMNSSDDASVTAVARGIQSVDSNHIQTIELSNLFSTSLDDSNWAPIVNLNAAYTYSPTYAEVLHAYNQSSSVPVYLVEANYEFEHLFSDFGSAGTLRRQEYWTMLSGATGQLYGNHYTWTFDSGWQSNLDTPGATQIGYLEALFKPLAWYNLVPDQNHTVVTAGYGTFSSTGSITDDDYLTAASTPDGTLVMAYMPTIRTITVNLGALSGPVTAQWFDPSAGIYTAIAGSPFANSGSAQFTPAGNTSDGLQDWVLVLTAP